jgi:hypothetical protein
MSFKIDYKTNKICHMVVHSILEFELNSIQIQFSFIKFKFKVTLCKFIQMELNFYRIFFFFSSVDCHW